MFSLGMSNTSASLYVGFSVFFLMEVFLFLSRRPSHIRDAFTYGSGEKNWNQQKKKKTHTQDGGTEREIRVCAYLHLSHMKAGENRVAEAKLDQQHKGRGEAEQVGSLRSVTAAGNNHRHPSSSTACRYLLMLLNHAEINGAIITACRRNVLLCATKKNKKLPPSHALFSF